jgi:hypothetical protein
MGALGELLLLFASSWNEALSGQASARRQAGSGLCRLCFLSEDSRHLHYIRMLCLYRFFFLGFVEKEIRKANIPIMDTGENPEVPFPRDMIDLEVNNSQITF